MGDNMSYHLAIEQVSASQLIAEYGGDDDDRYIYGFNMNAIFRINGQKAGFISLIVSDDNEDDTDDTCNAMAAFWEIDSQRITLGHLISACARWLWQEKRLPMEVWSARDDRERIAMLREAGFRLFRSTNDPDVRCPFRFRYTGPV